MLLVFLTALAEPTSCAQAPTPACLVERIQASPWMDRRPPKKLTVTIQGLLAALAGDEEAAEALLDAPDALFRERDFAHYDLVQVYSRLGRVDWARRHLERIPTGSALHWQGKLALLERSDPAKVVPLVKELPADLGFRGQVVAQAIGILLRADRADEALQLARTLPAEREEKGMRMLKPYLRDQGLAAVAEWWVRASEHERARALRTELSDPSELDALLGWIDADAEALSKALKRVPAEGWDRDQKLLAIGKGLITARRYELLPEVFTQFEVSKYSDPRRKLVTAHLLQLARHDDWKAVRKAFDAYSADLRSEAVYPLMILALEGEPTKAQVALAREALPQASDFSMGYQKELAEALLARALKAD